MQAAASAECRACGHLNRAGARFCATCGEPLAEFLSCPHCGASNPGAQKFCDRCDTPLMERVAVPGPDPRSYTPDHLAEKIHTARTLLTAAVAWLPVLGGGSTEAVGGHHQRLRVPQGFLGVFPAPATFGDKDATKVANIGIRTMRIGMNWSSVQPRPGLPARGRRAADLRRAALTRRRLLAPDRGRALG